MVSSQNSEPENTKHVTFEVAKDGWTGGLQLSINERDADGGGHGFRLAGPKFNGSSEMLLKYEVDERDAEEIREYLDAKFPPKAIAGLKAQIDAVRKLHLCVDGGPESDGYCNQCGDEWPCRTVLALDSIPEGGAA